MVVRQSRPVAWLPHVGLLRWSKAMTTDELLSAITAELSAIGAATDLGLISQDGERASAVLVIDDRRFCLSFEPGAGVRSS
jgi:hypothetical protein